jgi:hypothetical protein
MGIYLSIKTKNGLGAKSQEDSMGEERRHAEIESLCNSQ